MYKFTQKYLIWKSPTEEKNHISLSFSLFPEATCVFAPGCPAHHKVRLAERPASQLPALPPANPRPAPGPGGPIRRRDESGRVHQRSLQQQRAESVDLKHYTTQRYILFCHSPRGNQDRFACIHLFFSFVLCKITAVNQLHTIY